MTRPAGIAEHSPRHRRRSWVKRLTLLATGVFVLVGGGAGAAGALTATLDPAPPDPVSAARPMPASLNGGAVRAPFGDYVNRLSFDVTSVAPAWVTAAGPTELTVSGTMTNTGPEPLTNLTYRFQRGPALGTEADVRQELAEPSEPIDHVERRFTPITAAVAADATVPFSFTTSITDGGGLAVDAPGVYPLMVNVNGAVTLEGGPLEARVGELHLLLTVLGVPGTSPVAGPGTIGGTTRPLPVNLVWPLVDRPHLGVGGVFLDDDLLGAISPGGRLSTLVDGLTDPATGGLPGDSVTVVVDPQLLAELDRMTSAYRVVASPGDPQPPLTALLAAEGSLAATAVATAQASTQSSQTTANETAEPSADPVGAAPAPTIAPSTPATSAPATAQLTDPGSADIPGTVAGTGQVAAASFLARLRDVAARYPVLVLPYSDPDVVAVVRAGLVGELSATVRQGNEVAQEVLGAGSPAGTATRLDFTMSYPINGALDARTLAALRADGLGAALLSEDSIDPSGSAAAARVAAPGDTTEGVPAAIAQPDVLNEVGRRINIGRPGWAIQANALTGVLVQQSMDGAVTPAIFTPDRRWSPDAPGLRVLTDLLTSLGASGLISGIPLSALAASATVDSAADYPERARALELPAGYLDRIRSGREGVASLRQVLASTSQPTNPELVLEPLDRALDAAASTAFRQDPAVGDANLATVESTTAGIRAGVEILSAGNSYTLASSTSPLVVTVQNNTPYDVPVRVEISGGERVGLTVADPGTQVVPAGRSQQVKIPAEVTRSGQFQVTAQLISDDGTTWGAPVHLSVESNAYGMLTVLIILVAGGVLVVMVGLRIVQRLRGQPDVTPGIPSRDDVTRHTAEDRIDDAVPAAVPDVSPPAGSLRTGSPPAPPAGQPSRSAPAKQLGTERS